jgi:hypothetical protein
MYIEECKVGGSERKEHSKGNFQSITALLTPIATLFSVAFQPLFFLPKLETTRSMAGELVFVRAY